MSGQAVPYSRNYKQKFEYFRQQLRRLNVPSGKFEIKVRRANILQDSYQVFRIYLDAIQVHSMIFKMLFGIICAQHNWEMYCWISLEFNERWVKNYSTIIHKRGIKEEQQCLRICYESLRMVDNWQFGLFSGFHKSKTEDGPLEVQALDQLRRRGDTFYEVITMIIFDILQHKNIFDFAIKEQFNWYSSNFKKCILKVCG